MKKKVLTSAILVFVLVGILVPHNVFAANVGDSCTLSSGTPGIIAGDDVNGYGCIPKDSSTGKLTTPTGKDSGINEAGNASLGGWIFKKFAQGIGYVLMAFSGLVLVVAGKLFDTVMTLTVLEMGKNLSDPNGIGGSIGIAWATLRDIANMVFIFVLLYAAFKTMFDTNFGGFGNTVKNIIIVALLINFSLFFTKVVIDASNIAAVGFYQSITANKSSISVSSATGSTVPTPFNNSISAGYMNLLGLQHWYSPNLLTNSKGMDAFQVITVGLMSSIFFLITAVVLLISGIMFIARYVILIFLMILSPLAFIAIIIPKMRGKFDEWMNAVFNQAFFAPLFFALTWVVFKLASVENFLGSLKKTVQTKDYTDIVTKLDTSATALILNYVLVIGFSIAALIFAKQVASSGKVGGYFSKLTGAMGEGKVAGIVGGATLGGAAALSRRTVGAAASRLAQSQALDRWAGRSWLGEKVKVGTEKVAKSSFDIRQTGAIGGALQKTPLGSFGTGKAGGFEATLQKQTEKKEKIAAGLKTDAAKQAYAARQVSGILSRLYARGGSQPWNKRSLFGILGRSNRIVAARILGNQLTNLNNQRDTLQNRETSLTGQLSNMNSEQAVIQAAISAKTATPAQITRLGVLTAPMIDPATGAPNRGSIAYTQNQLNNIQTQLSNINNLINDPKTGVQTQINNLGITNPANQIVNPVTGASRPARADEQNY